MIYFVGLNLLNLCFGKKIGYMVLIVIYNIRLNKLIFIILLFIKYSKEF